MATCNRAVNYWHNVLVFKGTVARIYNILFAFIICRLGRSVRDGAMRGLVWASLLHVHVCCLKCEKLLYSRATIVQPYWASSIYGVVRSITCSYGEILLYCHTRSRPNVSPTGRIVTPFGHTTKCQHFRSSTKTLQNLPSNSHFHFWFCRTFPGLDYFWSSAYARANYYTSQ